MRRIPKKSFHELWPQGPASFLQDLNRAGFEAQSRGEISDSTFAKLGRARSCDLVDPQEDDFAFVAGDKRAPQANWSMLLVDRDYKQKEKLQSSWVVECRSAAAACDFLLQKIFPVKSVSFPIDPKDFPNIQVESGVSIGADVQIGSGSVIESNVRLGSFVRIGENCRIGANSVIADGTQIGNDCVFQGPVSLGGQGFGFVRYPNESKDRLRLHTGQVLIGDRVSFGAFVSVDRGVFEDTVVGDDVSLDNHVQIGHNCILGDGTKLCALVGLSGSTTLGKNVIIAGLSGSKEHVRVGDNVIVAAQSGLSKDIGDNLQVKGYPPRELKEELKLQVLYGKLPDLYKRLKKLEES